MLLKFVANVCKALHFTRLDWLILLMVNIILWLIVFVTSLIGDMDVDGHFSSLIFIIIEHQKKKMNFLFFSPDKKWNIFFYPRNGNRISLSWTIQKKFSISTHMSNNKVLFNSIQTKKVLLFIQDKPISNSSGCLIKKIDLFREQSKIDSPDNQSNIPAYWPFPIK